MQPVDSRRTTRSQGPNKVRAGYVTPPRKFSDFKRRAKNHLALPGVWRGWGSLRARAADDGHTAIAAFFFCHALQESRRHIHKLAAFLDVFWQATPQLFKFLRMLGSERRHADPSNGQTRWPPSCQEQYRPRRKGPKHQR